LIMPSFKAEKYITKAVKGEAELEEEAWKPIFARLDYPFTALPGRHMNFEQVSPDEESKEKILHYN
jgi:hypothetical protein